MRKIGLSACAALAAILSLAGFSAPARAQSAPSLSGTVHSPQEGRDGRRRGDG